MTWSNLSLTELKYNLTFSPSRLATKARWTVIGLVTVSFAFTGHYLLLHLPLLHLLIAAILLLILLYWLIPEFAPAFNGCQHLILTGDGRLISGAGAIIKISDKSRVYPWGCVLILMEEKSKANLLPVEVSERYAKWPFARQQLVFKDCLSDRDYRRLVRMVNS